MSSMKGVVSVFPSKTFQLQTTRSWDFIGFKESIKRNPTVESDIIIGVIDPEIWPELESLSDESFGPAAKNKIIGAQSYVGNDSARDVDGHGNHTASMAAGNKVKDVGFYGLAQGMVRVGVPSARIAAYKVCGDLCSSDAILAAFDNAIADGVDIITISIEHIEPLDFSEDVIAIAASRRIGSSSTRSFWGMGIYKWNCFEGCLDKNAVKGKIVLCDSFQGIFVSKDSVALGAISIDDGSGTDVAPLPAAALTDVGHNFVKSYLNSTEKPEAEILTSEAIIDSSAPMFAPFSSCWPNFKVLDILKPDLTAPGADILATYSPEGLVTGDSKDDRHVKYAAAAYIKTFHPDWSPSAIKSALMTTDEHLIFCIVFFIMGYDADKLKAVSGSNSTCNTSSEIVPPKDLNYSTLTAAVPSDQPFTVTFQRTVTNVGNANSTYIAEVSAHSKLNVSVVPTVLSFNSMRENESFQVTVTGGALKIFTVVSTSMSWSDGSHIVRSPIVIHTYHGLGI
ncbi:hypothetical protein SLEP1_g41537 [Rubroshorea leprosula]|nr:hypothetical protein SLEP1_g41537 [Rubroshorea leprosula]